MVHRQRALQVTVTCPHHHGRLTILFHRILVLRMAPISESFNQVNAKTSDKNPDLPDDVYELEDRTLPYLGLGTSSFA